MKLKSLLFGSAAVIAAGTGAQAADLPIVEPVEYVRICDAFGSSYYYIPGTDTCLRVAGRVRVESHYVGGSAGDLANFYGIGNANRVNNWTTRARGYVRLDARTQTDIGLVRTYISMFMTVGPANVTGNGQDQNYGGTAPTLEYAFIQISNDWGTYTAGHADSFFNFYDHHGFYNARGVGIDASTTQATLFGWTFAGGNGFSFTIAAEDPASKGLRFNGDDDYEGQEFPDGVANIRVDQGWGSAQIMGAVRHINDDNGDGVGFAVGGGVSLGIPGGWKVEAMGGYSEGAIGYITGDPGGWGDFDGPTGDQQNEAWAVKAGITGPVFTNVSVWLDGSFVHVEEADVGASGDEYDNWGLAVGGLWNPFSGLVMGPEFAYESHDQTDPNGDEGGSGNDWDVWSVIWRVQRDF